MAPDPTTKPAARYVSEFSGALGSASVVGVGVGVGMIAGDEHPASATAASIRVIGRTEPRMFSGILSLHCLPPEFFAVRFAPVARENLVGQTIAGYALESEVGEGGTASVFRAKHATHGTVAVKVLREKLRTDKTAVARFLREARYGERVQHPNVVRTLEIG